jgi:Tfp pilus assembly protein PilF
MLDRGGIKRAEQLLRRALEIEPHDPEVCLALAAIHEKLGRYAQAGEVLESVPLDRMGAEGRLRLAVNLARTGQDERATWRLELLFRGAGPAWVRVVACQELARLALLHNDAAAAAETLRRGLERWPDHPALQLQLAFAMDRLGKPREAGRLLEELDGGSAPRVSSERYRYNRWPRGRLVEGGRELAEKARGSLPELRHALQVGETQRE